MFSSMVIWVPSTNPTTKNLLKIFLSRWHSWLFSKQTTFQNLQGTSPTAYVQLRLNDCENKQRNTIIAWITWGLRFEWRMFNEGVKSCKISCQRNLTNTIHYLQFLYTLGRKKIYLQGVMWKEKSASGQKPHKFLLPSTICVYTD